MTVEPGKRMNTPLAKPLRSQLESTVKAARDVAEKAARAALDQLAIGEAKAPDYLTDEHKALRRRLRAHGRALGDIKQKDDTQQVRHLVWEVAYEHWHRMLFARFLAENGLLMWEPGAPVSLDDCRDMVDNHGDLALGAKSQWELAGILAARMLPHVFKSRSPVFELGFAPEYQRELERLLCALPEPVFGASDSLGWVYQFWQAKRKDEVNASEVKIGADELPAVTQLFTEPYMVDFLLHNSLGAWWVTRHPGKPCPVPLDYLRTLENGTPAAGKFEGWPDRLAEFTLLDPCCGSGHFLVAAFLMLVPMRMSAESLSANEAVDAVLAHNLYGLELDPRCVEIAVFALALAAWRFPDHTGNPLGVRADMPAPNVACCGLKVAASPKDWETLVPDSQAKAALLRQELRLLHGSFAQAPLLGSLLDPARSLKNDLATSSFDTLKSLLEQALAIEVPATLWGRADEIQDDTWDLALSARGLLDAARLLDRRYNLVVTNVPYLARAKHSEELKGYCNRYYQAARQDLASVFIERCYELVATAGSFCMVSPQNWWFLKSYEKFRRWLLSTATLDLVVALGEEAWEYFGARGPLATLLIGTRAPPSRETAIYCYDATELGTIEQKKAGLRGGYLRRLTQWSQSLNPDARIVLSEGASTRELLLEYASGLQGVSTSDNPRFKQQFWEQSERCSGWVWFQGSPSEIANYDGCDCIVWLSKLNDLLDAALQEQGGGGDFEESRNASRQSGVYLRGQSAWSRLGVAVGQMRELPASLYLGVPFDTNTAVVLPKAESDLAAIWCFCSSPEYEEAVRRIDQKVSVTNATLVKVPFDLARWKMVAADRYPNDLPKPYSDDPTQWLFHGHPRSASEPLQVAVARMLGYRWPGESDDEMVLSDEARVWIDRCKVLGAHVDDDGIVCLPSVRGEVPAHDRLLALLIDTWETVEPSSWKGGTLDKLLADSDCAGKGLDVWLRDKFFEQHVKLFHHRPFVWHVCDGLKDGFGALVNYHNLDARKLERLIHTYLGDWIRQQEAGVRDRVDGAQQRLAAARDLERRLALILEGEAPYDVFVRWKPLSEQPIGWNPDINDGVRLNIHPFMTAEVLRHNKPPKLNIRWDKDRGTDVASAPWFQQFKGERINDHHVMLAEKRAARGKR